MIIYKRLPGQVLFILILTCLTLSTLQAQECDCKTDVAFLVERYTKDYSGIQDFKISHPDFEKQFQSFIDESALTNKVLKCHQVIGALISYLDNGHVVFGILEENPNFDELYKDDDKDYYPSLIFPNLQLTVVI